MNRAQTRNQQQTPDTETVRIPPPRQRRKSLRHRFCDGIEAAVKAEPGAVAATRPRTMMGQIVQKLVCRAGDGRCDAVRLVAFFLDEAERRRVAAIPDDISQGSSEVQSPPEPKWDWGEEGGWDSSGREAPDEDKRREDEAKEAKTEALRAELRERFLRAAEADRINAARKARLEAEREGRNAIAEPEAASIPGIPRAPAAVPNAGNFKPTAALDPHAGIIRIGGRLVTSG